MGAEEDLERFEAESELKLYEEYRAIMPTFKYVVETERRFYLANSYSLKENTDSKSFWAELILTDAWVWDVYRENRFVSSVRVITQKDINIEELPEGNFALNYPGSEQEKASG